MTLEPPSGLETGTPGLGIQKEKVIRKSNVELISNIEVSDTELKKVILNIYSILSCNMSKSKCFLWKVEKPRKMIQTDMLT